MALPGDLSTFTLTLGAYTDAAGTVMLVGATAKLFPVDPATGKRLHLVHVATGQEIIPADIVITIGAGGTATVGPLPHTDNATLSTVGFAYKVEWQATSGRRRSAPDDKMFAVPTAAGASVDYDLLDVADAVPGVLVPVTYGHSAYDLAVLEGFVGDEAAWLASLVGPPGSAGGGSPTGGAGGALSGTYPNPGLNTAAVDTSVAASINDEASDTRTALDATFAPTIDRGEAFAAKVALGSASLAVGLASDSTGDQSSEWFRRAWDMWLAEHPSVTAVYHDNFDPTQSYTDTTIQTGTGTQTASGSDTFNRTAADLFGSTSSGGVVWGGGAGAFSIDGASAVSLGGSNGASLNLGTVGGRQRFDVNFTIDTTPGATIKRLSMYLAVSSSNRVGVDIQITTGGVITWTIYKQIAGVSAVVVSGTGTPLAASSVNTVDLSFELNGTAVTAILNGVTATGTLSGGDVAATAAFTRFDMSTANAASAGTKVNNVVITAYSTAPGLDIYNGSKSGVTLDYQITRLAGLYPEALDILFISTGHNNGTDTPAAYLTKLDTFLTAFRAVQPAAGIVLVAQNPQYPPANPTTRAAHLARLAAISGYAARHRYGYLPAAEAFLARPDGGATLVQGDGVHPTTTSEAADPNNGAYVWARTAKTYLDDLSGRLELVTANLQTGNYTLTLSDIGKVVEINAATATTLIVPANSSRLFPVGTVIEVHQYGAGQVTIVPASGVTLRSDGGKTKTAAQYATIGLRKRATDEWVLIGDLA